MDKKLPEWLNGCTICNVGLCSRMEELIEKGSSIQSASRKLEAEAFEADGVLAISRRAIESRYRRLRRSNESGWQAPRSGGSEIDTNLRRALTHIRTAKTKLIWLNTELQKIDATKIDGIEALLAKVNLAEFAKEFITFTQYFTEKGLLDGIEQETDTPRKVEGSKGG